MTEKERLLNTLAGNSVDRPPVVCPGGMMTMVSREAMDKAASYWPAAHRDSAKMAALSLVMHDESGVENIGIPFCMTVEAEALGGEVEDGDEFTEPRIIDYPLKRVADWKDLKSLDPERDGRLPMILDCTRNLAVDRPDIPVIGNLVGPLSLATSLIDPTVLYKALRKDPQQSHCLMSALTQMSIRYGAALVERGAEVIVIADPAATGEILGPKLFEEYAFRYITKITGQMHALHRPVIVHICGNIRPVYHILQELSAECLSIDSMVSMRECKESLPGLKLMGNVSTVLLQNGPIEAIRRASEKLLRTGVDILAPACGISAKTPLAHIRAMSEAARTRS